MTAPNAEPGSPLTSDSPSPARAAEAAKSGLAHFVVSRPVAVTMMVLAVCVFGAVSLGKLPVTLLPELSYPTLTVRTDYPGAAPAEIEELITKPLEENLAVVSNLTSYRSISRAGSSDVILEFSWNTPMQFAVQDVREKVDQLLPRLPRGVERSLILRYDPTFDPILRIGLYGDADLFRLRWYADEELKRRLENTPGVAAVKVKGGYEKELRVELDEKLLRQNKISLESINQRLQQENVNVAGGILRDGDVEYLVRTLNEFRTPDEIGALVISMQGGQPVRLNQLGRITPTNKERDVITRIEGRESVEIEIYKEADANLVQVGQAVKTRLFGKEWRKDLVDGEFRGKPESQDESEGTKKMGPEQAKPIAALMPAEMKLKVLGDSSVFIEQSLAEVRDNALQGAVLAILVLYAFLRRFKPTFIIAISIPISILATFAPLYLMGVSLNIMSLGGLALGVGMLVDNSIVVLEAVTRRRELGESVFAAAVNGTQEMAVSVWGSTLTTIVVFLPIVFVEGVSGQMFHDQALAIVFSLAASLVAAIVLVPMLASLGAGFGRTTAAGTTTRLGALAKVAGVDGSPWISWRQLAIAPGTSAFNLLWKVPLAVTQVPVELAGRALATVSLVVIGLVAGVVGGAGWLISKVCWPLLWLFEKSFNGFQSFLSWLLRVALKARFLTTLIVLGLSYAAFREAVGLKEDLIPPVHQGLFYIECQLDVGTSVDQTDERTKDLANIVRDAITREGIQIASISSAVGVPRDAIAKPGDGSHTSRLYVQLRTGAELSAVEERARTAARHALERVTGIGVPVIDAPQIVQTRSRLEVELVGTETNSLRDATSLLERAVEQVPGVIGARSTVRRGRPEITIRYDREALARYDLRLADVAGTIRNKIQGVVATRFTEHERKIDVVTRLPKDDLTSVATLTNLQINPGRTPPIPLSAVAQIDVADGPAEIRHVGGRRAEIIAADLTGMDLRGAGREIERRASELRRENPATFKSVVSRVAGQVEESARSTDSLLFALYLAIFLVYLVMAAQFESLVHPFVIMFTIPLALIGVVYALLWTKTPISVMAYIGVILLAGIVVNNAIILVDTVNRLRRDGWMRNDALIEAAKIRLRPIAMTTGTTVLGLVPLALGLGEGAEIRQPMAIVVIAGLTSSTLLTLVVIPVVYSFFSRSGPIKSEAPA